MDLTFFKKCLAEGMTKEEALAFTKASQEESPKTTRQPTATPKRTKALGSLAAALETIKGGKGKEFTTADLVKACEAGGSANPGGYANVWLRTQVENKKIVRTGYGRYKTL